MVLRNVRYSPTLKCSTQIDLLGTIIEKQNDLIGLNRRVFIKAQILAAKKGVHFIKRLVHVIALVSSWKLIGISIIFFLFMLACNLLNLKRRKKERKMYNVFS